MQVIVFMLFEYNMPEKMLLNRFLIKPSERPSKDLSESGLKFQFGIKLTQLRHFKLSKTRFFDIFCVREKK